MNQPNITLLNVYKTLFSSGEFKECDNFNNTFRFKQPRKIQRLRFTNDPTNITVFGKWRKFSVLPFVLSPFRFRQVWDWRLIYLTFCNDSVTTKTSYAIDNITLNV